MPADDCCAGLVRHVRGANHRRGGREGARAYGEERSSSGRPSEYDFVGGPLAAAVVEFRYFHELPEVAGPAVRSLHITGPFFGALVFFGVLIGADTVEIADFEDDPDYWSMLDALE